MKHKLALLLALILMAAFGSACAEAFTPITVDGGDYLTNIDTCIAAIDQMTIDTDQSFSFNEVVGERTQERGYCAAPNGRGVEVIGGGVGQVATTIYLAVKHADDLEVTQKRSYGSDFCGGYVPDEADAVLADYGQGLDFCFVNHGGPAVIRVWREDESVYCTIEAEEEAD